MNKYFTYWEKVNKDYRIFHLVLDVIEKVRIMYSLRQTWGTFGRLFEGSSVPKSVETISFLGLLQILACRLPEQTV